MNPGEVIAIVLLALILGACLLALGLFFWYLLRTMKQVEKSIGQFVQVLDPLVKSGALQQLSQAAAQVAGMSREMVPAMIGLQRTFSLFNKNFFDPTKMQAIAPEPPTGEYAAEGESGVFSTTEESAAEREVAENLRSMGIETDASRTLERPERMHGAKV